MANRLADNPIVLDTFSGDFTIITTPITVKKIILLSAADGDDFVMEDTAGNKVFHMSNTAGNADTVSVEFQGGFTFRNGLQVDVSDCTGLGANDIVWIYL